METPQNPSRALRRIKTGGLGRNRKTRSQPHQSLLLVTSHFLGYTLGYTKLLGARPLRITDKPSQPAPIMVPGSALIHAEMRLNFRRLADACGQTSLKCLCNFR
jgi:hypothetical protein